MIKLKRKPGDKAHEADWEEYKRNIARSTPVAPGMSHADIQKHRAALEANPEEWIKFFFPDYAECPFAPFHKKAIKRLINNPEFYEVLSWARCLSKSTITMFVVMYLALTGKKRNILLVSCTKDNAERLLAPYRANLEANERIKAYYGEQEKPGYWIASEFITRLSVAFRALGAGQPPRGSRNENIRPDMVLLDDFDTDEDCLNPETIKKKWDWWESALYFTRDSSKPFQIIFCGNIIAKDCCITRAGAIADHWDVVNIRDKNGVSTWPEKNTEEAIDRMCSKVSAKAVQRELYNNPVSEGEIFKELHWGKVPPLSKFKFLVVYGDPAPGENKGKKSSTKAVWLMGELAGVYYIFKGFLNRGLNSEFIDWYFLLNEYVAGKTTLYNYIENNSLQDPFFRQVFRPLLSEKCTEKHKRINILPDEEKKTDKATRIEANLEPINREGHLIFNIAEKENPDMQRLTDQFLLFSLCLKFPADGPDCIEGGKRIIDNKARDLTPPVMIPVKAFRSKNKYRL